MAAIATETQDGRLTIRVSGRFTFALFREFTASYKNRPGQPTAVDIDLENVEYLDSAALGMLMSMRNYFGADAPLRLLHPSEPVRKILDIARFERKFQIV